MSSYSCGEPFTVQLSMVKNTNYQINYLFGNSETCPPGMVWSLNELENEPCLITFIPRSRGRGDKTSQSVYTQTPTNELSYEFDKAFYTFKENVRRTVPFTPNQRPNLRVYLPTIIDTTPRSVVHFLVCTFLCKFRCLLFREIF